MRKNILFVFILLYTINLKAQVEIPEVYSKLSYENGILTLDYDGKKIAVSPEEGYSLEKLIGNPQAIEDGLSFDFQMPELRGKLVYGFIHLNDGKYPLPVYFHTAAIIKNGKAEIDIRNDLSGKYDMINWVNNGKGLIGYRVITKEGDFIFEGEIGFRYKNNQFSIDNTLIEGPAVTLLNEEGATIYFTTNNPLKASVNVGGKTFTDKNAVKIHEIKLDGLESNKKYNYEVIYGDNSLNYSFKTAPKAGTREPFMFAYTSDSRGGNGGGERDFYGPNTYIVKKIAALAKYKEAAFVQFTGDLIGGYTNSAADIELQYSNWKKAVEPFAHYIPFIATMGNHEVVSYKFPKGRYGITMDKFPFETESSEAIFAKHFVNPTNGPVSEDNSKYDPSNTTVDFPSYSENAFYYTYDNVAMVVLNSNYWYAPSLKKSQGLIDGNLHGYIMDNQLSWLEKTMAMFEKESSIDHIFVTIHTPAFPNGGHSGDDMWYSGKNSYRPYIAGSPVEKGIIERRDDFLEIIVNKSPKTVALLTGDEHNFNILTIDKSTTIYPEDWTKKKIEFSRPFYQINNGAAGAPYYAQEILPWSNGVDGFTTQNALVFVYVDGKNVKIEVINPVTFDIILEKDLR